MINSFRSASAYIVQVCEQGSLNKLILDDLLAKAQASDQCFEEARNAFKIKYSSKKFYIKGPFQRDESKSIGRLPDRVTINNLNVITNLFEIFHELISSVHISFDEISASDGKVIVKLINDEVSKSLTHLTIENCKENVLDELKSTFQHVMMLKFSTNLPNDQHSVSDNGITFGDIFPNLIVLTLGHTRVPDWKLIGNNFPNITYLSAESPMIENSNDPDETFVVELIKNSRKIIELILVEPSLVLLKMAKKKLPKLKTLTLKNISQKYANSRRDIHFDHVKYLTIHSNGAVPRNIVFDHLELLDLHVDSEFTEQWVVFLEAQINVGIRKLNINMENVRVRNFLNIANTLRKLKSASISCLREFSIAEIVQFVKKLKRAETINMKILMEKSQHNKLKAKLSNKWKFVSMDSQPHENTFLIDFALERYFHIFFVDFQD